MPKSHQAFEDATVQTFGLVNFVFSHRTFFFCVQASIYW